MEIATEHQKRQSGIAENSQSGSVEREKRLRKLFFCGLLAILVMTGILRFAGLGSPSFDGDEMYAVRIHGLTTESVGALFGRSAFHDLHPPLSYCAFLVWNQVFGLDEAAVRSLAVLWGLIAVAAIGLIARRLGGNLAGLAAALLLAFNPLHIAYSQEARPYSQAVALSLLALLFLLRSLSEGRRRDLLLYAAFCALAIYSHYFALLALAPHGLALVWLVLTGDEDSRRAARQTLLAFVCGFATYLAWVPALAHQMAENPEGPTLDVYQLGSTPAENLAVTAGYLRDVAGLGEMPYLLPALLAAAILLVFAATWKRRIAGAKGAAGGEESRPILPRRVGLALMAGAVVLGVTLALLAPVYLLPQARATLEGIGYSPAAVERELRSLLSFTFFVPAALFVIGAVVAGWRWFSALVGRLPRLGAGRPLAVPVLLGILFLIPAAATVLLATGGARFLSARNLLLFLPPLCLALAVGLARLASRRDLRLARLAALPLLFALGLSAFQYDPLSRLFGVRGTELGMTTGDWQTLAGRFGEIGGGPQTALPPASKPEPLLMVEHPRTDPGLFYLSGYQPERVPGEDAVELLRSVDGGFRYLHVEGNAASEKLLRALKRQTRLRPLLRVDEYVLYEASRGTGRPTKPPAAAAESSPAAPVPARKGG